MFRRGISEANGAHILFTSSMNVQCIPYLSVTRTKLASCVFYFSKEK